jgi:hypothetical protein
VDWGRGKEENGKKKVERRADKIKAWYMHVWKTP